MEYLTTDMSFGAYLLTTKRLRFLRIEASTPFSKIISDDPGGLGSQIEVEFANGASAPAADFHSKLRYLRKKLDSAAKESRNQAVSIA